MMMKRCALEDSLSNPTMKRFTLRTALLASLVSSSGSETLNSTCNVPDYYGQLLSKATTNWTRDDLEDLVRSTHTTITPFYSSEPGDGDILQALITLDPDSNQETINLFYSNIQTPQYPLDRSLWVPEHICPIMMSSVRMGDFDAAFSDLHNIQPTDPQLQEGNRGTTYFGMCPTSTCQELFQVGSETCICGDFFQPPPSNRGVVARSWLYMQLRYPDVSMSDCQLETLLAWHRQYPPTATELVRNSQICANFQGNRNPYVDYPELAETIRMYNVSCEETVNHGEMGNTAGNPSAAPVANGQDDTRPTNAPVVEDDREQVTNAPTPTPEESNIFDNRIDEVMDPCSMLLAGDVYFYSVQSSPTRIGMIPMIHLPQGLILYISTTPSLLSSSATSVRIGDNYPDLPLMRLVLNEDMTQGIPFGYGNNLLLGSSWEVMAQPVTLNGGAIGGDEVFLFCYEEEGAINLISALTTNGAFQDSSLNGMGFGRIILPEPMDYYVYNGPLFSSNSDYQKALMDPTNWRGFDVMTSESSLNGQDGTNLRVGGQQSSSSSSSSGKLGMGWVSLLGLAVWLGNA